MARSHSISTEIIRGELRRDCEAAGYSDADADALADRIIDGWVTPGLAIALGQYASNETRSAAVDRFDRTPSDAVQVPASLFENSTGRRAEVLERTR